MQLMAFISDIWCRAKNLRLSNSKGEKTAVSDKEQGGKSEMKNCEDSAGLFAKDGMSTATARFIIERDVGEMIGEDFDVADLTNTGRYYIAKIVRPDGSVIERLLVDKQNCRVYLPKGKYR